MHLNFPKLSSNGWYAITRFETLSKGMNSYTFFEKKIIILKTSTQKISAFEDSCPHRGYPLSAGSYRNGQVICPYHGWCFNDEGNCSKVPGLDNTPRFKLNTINLKIESGLVWLNNSEEKTLPAIYKRKTLKHSIMKSVLIDAPPFLLIENTLDPMHTPYIHKGLVRGNKEQKKKEVSIKITTDELIVTAEYLNEGKQDGLISKLFAPGDILGVGKFIYPGIIELEFKTKDKDYLIFTAYLTPSSVDQTSVILNISYNSLPFHFDIIFKPLFSLLINKVLSQDKVVCEKQYENLKVFSNQNFQSTKLDYMFPYLKEIIELGSLGKSEKIVTVLL